MPSSADLESLFAGVYTQRLPIALASAAVAILLIVLAVRGRWDRVAARHRLATGVIVVVVLVVGLPAVWYLGSPLFLSTELVEPVPAAVTSSASPVAAATSVTTPIPGVGVTAGPSLTGSAAPSAPPSAPPSAAPPSAAPSTSSPAGPSAAAATETSGKFSGTDDFHFGRGTARLIVAADGSATLRFEDFAVRNGPDLFVYLSPDKSRYTKAAIELGRLKADRGSFNYTVPAGTDLSAIKSAVIWCKQFSFQFAVAPLS